MYRVYVSLVEMLRRLRRSGVIRAAIPKRLGNEVYGVLVARKRAYSVKMAHKGKIANLDDIESFIVRSPVPLTAPMVLISQSHRSGGTLLSQLFDGHPALAAHPHELKIGYPGPEDWPELDPGDGAEDNFLKLFEFRTIRLMREGYLKGRQDPSPRPFFNVPRIQSSLFRRLYEERPPEKPRDVLDLYFTSYFNSWLNYRSELESKKWITAFAPRLSHHEGNVERFFRDYPDGLLVQILRDPFSWYPSAKFHDGDKAAESPVEKVLEPWLDSARAMLRNKAKYAEKVVILRFEDLVGDTHGTMRRLASVLNIEFSPVLLTPTFNGETTKANSSFPVPESGVIGTPLARSEMLSEIERAAVKKACQPLYDEFARQKITVAA